jgi:hypothetical protein
MIDMDYKSNSHKSKEEQKEPSTEVKKIEKVVTGNVRTRKQSDLRKWTDVFISEDASNVKSYILMDVLVPAIKDAIEDIITNGIRMILRGETSARKSSSSATKVSYRNYYDNPGSDKSYRETRTQTGYSYEEIVLDSRGEGEEVLIRMDEIINEYGKVSVADLYDLVGKSGPYTNNNYGWTNIRSAEVVRVRDGYWLKLPKALPLRS